MHIISRVRLADFWEKHPNAQTSLRLWYKLTSLSEWSNLLELRESFPAADQVSNLTVFNTSGNNYRLITLVDYKYQKVFIRHILTHADY
ncbi:MAG: type II toxin-antitoxin system HigB family toxin [Komarekiella atlantica HA4396-MV6]|jgi:mRNA interferase HigB|nr:type II toxin-antitoxin system HigB family toxin [Komarekiella atlantica HA4396-MV6]